MKQFFLRLIAVLAVILPKQAWAQEPYAVLSDDSLTVTFYYDDQREARGGIDINNNNDGYNSPYGTATTAVIDASFANYYPLSTAGWFAQDSSLTTIIGMEYLNTQVVFDMSHMFDKCKKIKSLNLSNFNMQFVMDMGGMFRGCSSLTSLNLSNFNTQNVTNMDEMFCGCVGLTSIDLSNFDTQNVTNMGGMFRGCYSLTSLDLSSFNTQNVTNMGGMFRDCSSLTSLDLSSFNTQNVTNMDEMFYSCFYLTSLDLSNFDTQNVTNMGGMFHSCERLTSLELSRFNTSKVTNMVAMFCDCYSLTNLNLAGFNTQNVTNMEWMFDGCRNLTSLDLSGFDTQNVTNMGTMFRRCSSLTSLDVSGFNTQSVYYFDGMFYDCSRLKTIFASSMWDMSKVKFGSNMFGGCTSLVGGQGTVYDENHTDHTYARIDGGADAPGYFTSKPSYSENVTTFSSPSFTVTLNPNGGTAQYFTNYYRLGNGGSLTLQGKSNVDRIVSVKMNLQDPARCGNDVRVSAGTLVGDTIINVYDSTLTITAQGAWPQLWLSSLEVAYEGSAPYGTYAILLPQHLAHGTVTSDHDWANEGDVVTLTATPDDDCHLKLLYANQGAVTLTPSATSIYRYTFTMPAEDVTVGALFAEGAVTTGVLLNVPEDSGNSSNDKPIYNLQGQRMKRPQRGINIVGGQKVVRYK